MDIRLLEGKGGDLDRGGIRGEGVWVKVLLSEYGAQPA
jgi:hypothetical protein